jgi:hypothetical protein
MATYGVYSTRFLHQQRVAGTSSYTVPTGFRAVVKDINVANVSAASAEAQVLAAGVILAANVIPAEPGVLRWQGMAVVYHGETIQVVDVSGLLAVYVSGYLLTEG